jgi:hypothetical protein
MTIQFLNQYITVTRGLDPRVHARPSIRRNTVETADQVGE